MQIILLEKIRNLGELGDQVKVKAGYGRNFLVPQGKAVPATADNVKYFEGRREELEKKAADKLSAAQARLEQIQGLGNITITAKAGDEGKLFGSIGTRDIAQAITQAGVETQKAEVLLPHGVIRNTGEYEIEIQAHSDVSGSITLAVVPE